jgi:hypothetical protein
VAREFRAAAEASESRKEERMVFPNILTVMLGSEVEGGNESLL